MRALVSQKNKLIFLWSPKAGCSTAARIFLSHEGFPFRHDEWIHKARERYEAEVHPSRMPENPGLYRKIQFVRNPFQRSVSSFLLSLEHHASEGHHNLQQSKEMFTRFLESVRDGSVQCPHCAFHALGQFMTEDVDMLVRIENIDEDIRRVNESFGLNLDSAKTVEQHSYRKRIMLNGQDPNKIYDEFLGADAMRLVKEAYRRDFEFLPY